uniref:Uncharacterized protein n=1 Tax=Aegilops tauschii subsp. strangulata TaxID=200361 RepID=A0A453DCJ3_AEGTS
FAEICHLEMDGGRSGAHETRKRPNSGRRPPTRKTARYRIVSPRDQTTRPPSPSPRRARRRPGTSNPSAACAPQLRPNGVGRARAGAVVAGAGPLRPLQAHLPLPLPLLRRRPGRPSAGQ